MNVCVCLCCHDCLGVCMNSLNSVGLEKNLPDVLIVLHVLHGMYSDLGGSDIWENVGDAGLPTRRTVLESATVQGEKPMA